jgi:gas vesicle protein
MKMRKMMSFMAGAMIGGLVGATIALLLAPSGGKALQDKMKNTFIELKDEVTQAAEDRRKELNGQLETLRKG